MAETIFFKKNISIQQSTMQNPQPPMEIQLQFYKLISSGKLQDVEDILKNNYFFNICKSDIISENNTQNARYHFVIIITMLTYFCMKAGMPEIQAHTIQNQYIQSADRIKKTEDIIQLHDEACMEYALKMKRIKNHDISSKHIIICINYIQKNIQKKMSVPEIAAYLHLHPSYLSKLFQEQMGCSIHSYIIMQKIEEAKDLLKYTDFPCRAIASSLSFSSQSHFIQSFQKYTHLTPRQYRNQQTRNNIIDQPLSGKINSE